jgi:hypothetical protein
MNLRSYLLLLRPARTIIATGLSLLAFTFFFVALAGRLSGAKYLAVLFCFAAPFIVGGLLVGPLFELAHRSSFPLLPGAARKLLRWHLAAYSFAALALFGLLSLSRVQLPAPATLGAILVSLALPLVNPAAGSSLKWRSGFFSVAWWGLACCGHKILFAALQNAPWAVLFVGVVTAALCFHFGFAPNRLRARSSNPLYFAPQTTLVFVGTEMLHYRQAETARAAEHSCSRRGAH